MNPDSWLPADATDTRLAVLAAVLVAAGLSGCVSAVAETSTGMEQHDPADQRAQAWDADAELVRVAGGEHAGAWDGHGSNSSFEGQAGEVGDGNAPAWAYTYETDERALHVVVDANGTVVNATEAEHRNRTPVTGWNVDSTEAVETVREHHEGWAEADPDLAFYGLWQNGTDEDPVWGIGALDEDRFLFATVNATTGEYLGGHAFGYGDWGAGWGSWGGWSSSGSCCGSWNGSGNDSWGPNGAWSDTEDHPPRESGTLEGEVSALDPEAEHRFALGHGEHETLRVVLELDDPQAGSLEAEVAGPDAERTLTADPLDPRDEAQLDDPQAGAYTVDVELEAGATQGYTLHWCAPGTDEGDPRNPACPRVGTDVRGPPTVR
jgi:hypothetical protein